ncbi:MAG: sulfatase-like hydrolase/transferase [Oscillospiraceae bacterium]
MNNENRQVVFIMTDSTRFDWIGCYGNSNIKTPCIDKLSKSGVRFNKAYTCQPVCGPARSAIFTGLYPHSNGSWANSMPLGANVKTIGQRLSDNDIHTAFIGKWHLDGGDYFGNGICPDGWDSDYWYDMRNYLYELSPEQREKSRVSKTCFEDGGITEDFTFGHQCANRALDFLEKFHGEDFFLTVSFDEPHDPFLCPEPYASMYNDYELPKAPNIWDNLENKPESQKYWAGNLLNQDKDALKLKPSIFLGCNSFVDYEIGRVIDAVEKFAPSAMIIFTSDHGDAQLSHSIHGKGASIYDEISRIPLIIKGGAFAPSPKNTVTDNLVSHINIVPTIMEYFNIPIPKILEGKSILNSIKDPNIPTNDEVFVEFGRYEIDHDGFGGFQLMRAVITDKYKMAIHLLDNTDELYDVENDCFDMVNLINSPDLENVRDELHDKILNFMNVTRDPFRGYQWANRPFRKNPKLPSWEVDGYTRQREVEENEPHQLDYSNGLEIKNTTRLK